MSSLHIRQIKNGLETIFNGLIDKTDLEKKQESDKEKAYLSRCLAAFAVFYLNSTTPIEAANSIIDGYKDNGIDAIHFSPTLKQLTIVQAKWNASGNGSISLASTLKFLKGAREIIDCNFDNFNKKINPIIDSIQNALCDFEIKINLVLIHTGKEKVIPFEANEALESYITEINDNGGDTKEDEKVQLIHFNQSLVYTNIIQTQNKKSPIELRGIIHQWGKISEPYYAINGYITGEQISNWWNDNKQDLFSKNIRSMLGDTTVNDEMKKTLIHHPELFWYFNNGITIIADLIIKSPIHGNNSDAGVFTLKNANIVNGAQTVSSIGTIKDIEKGNLEKALIPIKVISLQNAPEDFGKLVTRNTNRQNKIENIDFMSLDSEQIRIQKELQLESIEYRISRGIYQTEYNSNVITINEAITALACLKSLELAVQAKREIGVLEDIYSKEYQLIFNKDTHGILVKNAVFCFRNINEVINVLKTDGSFKNGLLIHGNRFITYALFYKFSINKDSIIKENFDVSSFDFKAGAIEILKNINDIIQQEFSDTVILATLFKNGKKCRLIFDKIFN